MAGSIQWTADRGSALSTLPNGNLIWASRCPAVGQPRKLLRRRGRLLEGRLYRIERVCPGTRARPKNGKVIWKTGVAAPIRSGPTVADGRVYAVTVENELVALAADDGRRLWAHNGIPETAGLVGSASPAVEGESWSAAEFSSANLRADGRERAAAVVGQPRFGARRGCGFGAGRYPRASGDRSWRVFLRSATADE